MAITETIDKRRLVITLGEHGAPASWEWQAVRFLRNDDGSDAAPPQNVIVPATEQEVAAHIGAAQTAQVADINALHARIGELTTERNQLTEALAQARAAAHAVDVADAAWEAQVRPLIAGVVTS